MPEYELKRTDRRTLVIKIRMVDGVVEVRAPKQVSRAYIDEFVASKEDWIRKKLAEAETMRQAKETFNAGKDGRLLYCGNYYPIEEAEGGVSGYDGSAFRLPLGLTAEEKKRELIEIYKGLARQVIPPRVKEYAGRMGLQPAAVKINSAKKRWGSCTSKNNLNFSWMLVMADIDAIDYVVVHELSHLIEYNHSAKFWEVVEGILPDYKERSERLVELGKSTANEEW